MFEIKIYGDIIPFEDKSIIEKGGYCNLSSLQEQLDNAKGQPIKVRIRSFGGDVETGFSMYNELRRYAKENKVEVTTIGEGQVASIATIIFLAGDHRILTENTEPFVHNAWTYEIGDSKMLRKVALELEKCNEKIANHYALHTNLTFDEALILMENETSISTEEAVKLRFATQKEEVFRPINKLKLNIRNMKQKSFLAKVKALFFNKVVFDAENNEVDFFELGEDDVIEIGAKATIDGNPAEGEVVMATGETFVFSNGELTEIIAVEEETEETEDVEALKAEIEELKSLLNSAGEKYKALKKENAEQKTAIANFKNLK